jgi:hypothetical protein
VLKDIEKVSKAGFPQVEFDFDPFTDDRSFYFNLFDEIEKKDFPAHFTRGVYYQKNFWNR